jgi:hypothetical protein
MDYRRFPPPIKLSHHITEILLKVALNTIRQTKQKIILRQNKLTFKYGNSYMITVSQNVVHLALIEIYYVGLFSKLCLVWLLQNIAKKYSTYSDHHNITETLLKVALNTIKQTNQIYQKIHVIQSINIQQV